MEDPWRAIVSGPYTSFFERYQIEFYYEGTKINIPLYTITEKGAHRKAKEILGRLRVNAHAAENTTEIR